MGEGVEEHILCLSQRVCPASEHPRDTTILSAAMSLHCQMLLSLASHRYLLPCTIASHIRISDPPITFVSSATELLPDGSFHHVESDLCTTSVPFRKFTFPSTKQRRCASLYPIRLLLISYHVNVLTIMAGSTFTHSSIQISYPKRSQ